MDLRNIEATLPPGFRFYPSDEELICHYLYKKITNERALKGTLVEVDLHTCEPWQLPEAAKLGTNEWYFFSFRDRKYATGFRTNRATMTGYWKATGKDRPVFDPITHDIVGMRKTLVFYQNRAPNGIKTAWVMHEFRLENPKMPPKEDWVLCRVFHKSKEEKLENELMRNNTVGVISSPSLASPSPPIDQRIIPSGLLITSFSQIPHHQNQSLALLNPNQEGNTTTPIIEFNSKGGDDEYGFLLDVSSLEDGGPTNLEDLRFEDDHSMVFF